MRYSGLGTLALAILGGCTTARTDNSPPIEQVPASSAAQIRDVSGRNVAAISLQQAGDALRVRVESSGLAAGVYAIHIHSVGRCDPPGFDSAGPHWNPANREHGRDNPRGQHLGDLPNLLVGTDGRGSFEFTVAGAGMTGGARRLLDADGAAIVLHARPDDYRTDPSGNSGARIACGVID